MPDAVGAEINTTAALDAIDAADLGDTVWAAADAAQALADDCALTQSAICDALQDLPDAIALNLKDFIHISSSDPVASGWPQAHQIPG